jgi:hypothetical protein
LELSLLVSLGHAWLMPLLGLAAGFASLMLNNSSKDGSKVKTFLICLLLATFVWQVVLNAKASDDNLALKQQLVDLTKTARQVDSKLTNGLSEIKATLRGFGYPEQTVQALGNSFAADKGLRALASSSTSRSRSRITVQYFPKNIDPIVIRKTIAELGFKQEIFHPNNPYYPTNAVWFGQNVNVDDAKLIAMSLIRAGVSIRSVMQIQGSSAKNLIQVGVNAKAIASPPLSVEAIARSTSFPVWVR